MSENAAATETKKRGCPVAPFTIEANHPRNSNLAIQSIPGALLRSRIVASRTVKDAVTGEERIPVDQTKHLGLIPELPGMRLYVNPARLSYKITDPLLGQNDLLDKVQQRWNSQSFSSSLAKLRGVPDEGGQLDVHRMKTLCWELMHIIKAGEATLVEGAALTEEAIEELPGHLLLNPGSRVRNTQPKFAKDFEAWIENLDRHGG